LPPGGRAAAGGDNPNGSGSSRSALRSTRRTQAPEFGVQPVPARHRIGMRAPDRVRFTAQTARGCRPVDSDWRARSPVMPGRAAPACKPRADGRGLVQAMLPGLQPI